MGSLSTLFKPKGIFLSFLVVLLAMGPFIYSYVEFQPASADTTYQCDTPEQKAACTALLDQTEQEINDLGSQLSSTMQQGTSLARDKAVLDLQIKQAQLKIQAKELTIANLGKDITSKNNTITALSTQINQNLDAISQIIRRTREVDNLSVAEALLSDSSITDFFVDADTFASIKRSLQVQLDDVRQNKDQTQAAKDQLSAQKDQEVNLEQGIIADKNSVQTAQQQKALLLSLNQNQQQNYKTQIANKQEEAAKIKNALFALRDSASIKFGDAVTYANEANAKTGVPAAFVLAILQQESNLGQNVGGCYLSDESGAGIRISSGAVVSNLMKPSRDVQPFLQITQALNRDPYKTLVSCPLDVGYGGAMGPAQFIPSTWAGLESRITADLGESASDPWAPLDAIMASSIYLADLGASGATYTAEIKAACKYYGTGGSTCSYGKQVMSKVAAIQANIDILNNSGS